MSRTAWKIAADGRQRTLTWISKHRRRVRDHQRPSPTITIGMSLEQNRSRLHFVQLLAYAPSCT
jgi:hypothetical protein